MSLKNIFFEDDTPAPVKRAETTSPTASGVSSVFGNTPIPPTSGFPGYTPPSPVFGGGIVLTPDDQKQADAIRSAIYALNPPSTYVAFDRAWKRMNSTTDLKQVFDVLSAANPDLTPQHVIADIDRHIAALVAKKAEFEANVKQATVQGVDNANNQIAQLSKRNTDIQAEMTKNMQQIAELTAARDKRAQSLADGKARFGLIESQLSAPLLQAKALLQGAVTP